ncbi:hypothetical protein ACROYT_G013312 [Oculina patagonica]
MWISMAKNVQTDLLEQQRSMSPSTASASSEGQGHDDFLDLLQRQPQTLLSTVVCVTSKENENTSRRSQEKTESQDLPRIQPQPISVSLAFGGKSTLRGTPWEEALCGDTPQTGKRSKKAGKPVQRTVKEKEIVSFWTQFFG